MIIRPHSILLDSEALSALAAYARSMQAWATVARRKPRDLTVAALVAATAFALPAPLVILTSDPADLDVLLSGTPVQIEKVQVAV